MLRISPHLFRYWNGNDYKYYHSDMFVISSNLHDKIISLDLKFCIEQCPFSTPCNKGRCHESPIYVFHGKKQTCIFFAYPIHQSLEEHGRMGRTPKNRIEGFTYNNSEIKFEDIKSNIYSIIEIVDKSILSMMMIYYKDYSPKVENIWNTWVTEKDAFKTDILALNQIEIDIQCLNPINSLSRELYEFWHKDATSDTSKMYDFCLFKEEELSVKRIDDVKNLKKESATTFFQQESVNLKEENKKLKEENDKLRIENRKLKEILKKVEDICNKPSENSFVLRLKKLINFLN